MAMFMSRCEHCGRFTDCHEAVSDRHSDIEVACEDCILDDGRLSIAPDSRNRQER